MEMSHSSEWKYVVARSQNNHSIEQQRMIWHAHVLPYRGNTDWLVTSSKVPHSNLTRFSSDSVTPCQLRGTGATCKLVKTSFLYDTVLQLFEIIWHKLPSNIFGRLKIWLFHSIFIQFFVRAVSIDKSESVQIRGCLQIGDIENCVCTRVTNCFSADERVILVFMSRVAKQPGK